MNRQIRDAQLRSAVENKALASEKLVGTLDMQYIAHEKRFVGNLHVHIALTMQRLAEVEKTLSAARTELFVAAKARKVIEKLREKQFARWRAELDRKEAMALDEIGTQNALRQAMEQERIQLEAEAQKLRDRQEMLNKLQASLEAERKKFEDAKKAFAPKVAGADDKVKAENFQKMLALYDELKTKQVKDL